MNRIQEILSNYQIMLLDGATATELEARGCDIGDDLWSSKILFEQPELIKQVHLDYLEAGSDIAVSVSYQATVEGFCKRGFSKEKAEELIMLSVQLAAEARNEFWRHPKNRCQRPFPIAAASVGPYGAYLADGSEYIGNYGVSDEVLADFHRERMNLFKKAGAELLCCETLPCLQEVKVLTRLIEKYPDLLCWISFSCRDGGHISDGMPIEEAVSAIQMHPQVAAVGINCIAPQYVEELIKRIKSVSDKPVVVYPNSGEEYDPVTKVWNGAADGIPFEQRAKTWYEIGARMIGGCCRTNPGHIRKISKMLR